MNIFIGFVLGILASALAALFYEYATRPLLRITIDPSGRVRGAHPQLPPHEFLHLVVHNAPPWWPLPSRKPAWSTQARIEVLNKLDSTPVVQEPIYARWTSQPEPLIPVVASGGPANLIDPAKLIAGRRVDVHSHEGQQISLLIKFEGEDDCYIFSNESYQYPKWQNPQWRVPLGTFLIRATVYYERRPAVANFTLANKGPSLRDVHLTA